MSSARRATDEPRTVRGRMAVVGFVIAVFFVVVLLGDVLVRGTIAQAFEVAPLLLLPLWCVWTFLTAPFLRSGPAGVVVRNPLCTTTIPWPRIADVTLRWQAVIQVDDGSEVPVWAMAAERRRGSRAGGPAAREAEILQERRERAQETDADGEVVRRWNWPELAALVVLVGWLIAALSQN